MPELPEVETIKRELEQAVLDKKITGVVVNSAKVIRQPGARSFVRQLKGRSIKKILRRGKLLILELSPEKFLTIHLKMTGQLIYPGDAKRSRVSFSLSDGKILDFNDQRLFAELRLIDDWSSLKFIKNLGPEPFDLDPSVFRRMLALRRTRIKPLLLDQSFISGVGNLYAAEALFRAGINPQRTASSLSGKEKNVLLRQLKQVLREAIKHKGSSVDQYVQLSGSAGGYVKHHKVYGRQGQPCCVCKTKIERISLGGRGTYFCPKCQK